MDKTKPFMEQEIPTVYEENERMIEQLQQQIKVVAEARQEHQEMADKKEALYEEFRSKHIEFFGDVATAKTLVEVNEEELRKLTLLAYAETGDKAPAVGVGIREVTKYSYNSGEALKWAIEHTMALKLDETKFKNHVKADPPDFVKITTEPQATIATELKVE